jgi:hydroxymethylpyrimidine/phosphomethylpyrimidine kinase
MMGCRSSTQALPRILARHAGIPVVADPVLRASSGRWLLEKEALPAYLAGIRGRVTVLTPNLSEAALISGLRPADPEGMKEAARRIVDRVAAPCLVKGGHLAGRLVDVLYDGRQHFIFPHRKVSKDVHGTGCFLSASLLSYLVMGHPLAEACALACEFTQAALGRAVPFGKGREMFFSF